MAIRQLSQPTGRAREGWTPRLPWHGSAGCGRHRAAEAPGRLAALVARIADLAGRSAAALAGAARPAAPGAGTAQGPGTAPGAGAAPGPGTARDPAAGAAAGPGAAGPGRGSGTAARGRGTAAPWRGGTGPGAPCSRAPRGADRPRRPSDLTAPRVSRRTALTTVSLVTLVGLSSLERDGVVPGYPAGRLRVATGPTGGVYFAYGHGIAEVVRHRLPRLSPAVLPTQGSAQNMEMLAAGAAEVAFCLADSAAAAVAGQRPFRSRLDVVALARLYDNYMHLVVPADSRVRTMRDLRGLRVAIGSPGSGTELLTLRLLKVGKIDPNRDIHALRINVDAAAPALAAGHIDAFFFSGGIPVSAIEKLNGHVRLIGLGDLVRGMLGMGEFYSERTIPPRPYRLAEPVPTVGEPNFLMVAGGMDERVAYQLTKALFAGRDELAAAHPEGRRLDRGVAIATYPLALHPGAVRYYREAMR